MKFKGKSYPDPVQASTIEPKDVQWLWYPYIPAGSASMIFGPGGSGKSHIAVDLASKLSTGGLLPGMSKAFPPQEVLMLSAEDEPERVLIPRLIKAKADLKKVYTLSEPLTLDKDGLEVIEHYIAKFSVGIVFIDPIVAYIGGKVDINRANETRVFTGGLHRIAMDSGTPIVVVHHARKGTEGADFDRMMGSADFNNAVRSVLYTTQAPNGDRIMKHVKANYAALGPTLGYAFGDEGFEWTGVYKEDGTKATHGAKRTEAADWLREKLADGPVRSTVIEQGATQKGFNHRTLVRAKMGIAESYLVHENGKMTWYWRAIGDANAAEADVPVMDVQWKAEKKSRTERELVAREDARVSENVRPVGGRGLGASGPKGEDLVAKWVKENL